jgi:hypothetical protein
MTANGFGYDFVVESSAGLFRRNRAVLFVLYFGVAQNHNEL